MKASNAVLSAMLAVGGGAAHADNLAANEAVQEYLVESGLMSEPLSVSRIEVRETTEQLDPTTAYLVESGLIEAPTVVVDRTASTSDLAARYSDSPRVAKLLVDWGLVSPPVGKDHPSGE